MKHRTPSPRPRRTRSLATASILLTTALALSACGAGGADPEAAAPMGEQVQSITVLATATANSFSADKNAGNYEAGEVMRALHSGLIRYPYVKDDLSGQLKLDMYSYEPELAESFEVSDDGLTVTFVLKEGVLSAAGNPLTADDVIWTIDRRYKNATSTLPVAAVYMPDPDTAVAKLDDRTVSFTVSQPGFMTQLLYNLADGTLAQIYDSELLIPHGTATDPYALDWSMLPENANYGFGPYFLESFRDGEEMVLVTNPNSPTEEPAITEITYRVVPDAGTRTSALMAGDGDIALQIRAADQATLVQQGFGAPMFDYVDLVTVLDLVVTKAPFDDVKVRQALRHAIPYEQIVDNVYLGRATTTRGVLDSSAPWWVGDGLDEPLFDPEKSLQMLDDAGYVDPVPFTISVMSGVPDTMDAAIQIQSFAEEGGFDVEIKEIPYADYYAARAAYSEQALLEKYGLQQSSPAAGLTNWFRATPRTNPTGWVNEEYLEILDVQGGAVSDPFTAEAGELWNRAEQIVQEETPLIWLARTQTAFVAREGIDGLVSSRGPVDYTQMVAYAAE